MKTTLLFSALMLGCAFAAIAPASAAPPPPFPMPHFHLQIGPDTPPPDTNDDNCMNPHQIFHSLRMQGYDNFTNVDDSADDTITLDAQRHHRWYELDVDSCTGDVTDRTRIDEPN